MTTLGMLALLFGLTVAAPLTVDQSDVLPKDVNQPGIDEITISRVIHAVPSYLRSETKSLSYSAPTLSGRAEMGPNSNNILDPDCDSPQIGEEEQWPVKALDLNTNTPASRLSNAIKLRMSQQSEDREVLDIDKNPPTRDDPLAYSGALLDHPSDFKAPTDSVGGNRVVSLPPPTVVTSTKLKCSRSENGNDVPDAISDLGDECGTPEPAIPCETVGNSTKCLPRVVIKVPPTPQAEFMPPMLVTIPIHSLQDKKALDYLNISVEFVDFGISRDVLTHASNSVARLVEEAGQQFGIDRHTLQLVRSGGVDVASHITVDHLPDRSQIIVYLSCLHRKFHRFLIARLPACEDSLTQYFRLVIEIPAFHAVYSVTVPTTETVRGAVSRAPFNLRQIESVTYQGKEVVLDASLESISFQNYSALIVYPDEPCPTQSTSPSNSPTPLPSPSSAPSVSNCPYVPYVPVNASAQEEANSETHVVIEPEEKPPRPPMTEPAEITVVYLGRSIPVLIKPLSQGIDLFDAVERVSGQSHTDLTAVFLDRVITHSTPLKPFGFVTGDIVNVKFIWVPDEPSPNGLREMETEMSREVLGLLNRFVQNPTVDKAIQINGALFMNHKNALFVAKHFPPWWPTLTNILTSSTVDTSLKLWAVRLVNETSHSAWEAHEMPQLKLWINEVSRQLIEDQNDGKLASTLSGELINWMIRNICVTSYNPASHQMLISANSHIALLHLMHSPSPFVAKVSALVGAAVILGGGGEDVRRQGTSLLSEGEGDEEGRERERLLVLNDKLLSEVVEAYAATLDGRPYPPNSRAHFTLWKLSIPVCSLCSVRANKSRFRQAGLIELINEALEAHNNDENMQDSRLVRYNLRALWFLSS